MQTQTFLRPLALALLLLPLAASALVMRENGPEPIIVQIKESLRLSDDLDARLNDLAAFRQQNNLRIEKWWAGSKLLVMLSFPANFSEEQAMTAIRRLEASPAVEKVVALSAANLEFRSGDFAREYTTRDAIPDVARRGFDADRIGRPTYRPPDELTLFHTAHVPDRLIVRWKEEYVWNAERTRFNQRIAAFNRDARCRVVHEERHSPTVMIQILESDDISLLGDKLKRYMDSGLVVYAQPDYLYAPLAHPNDPAYDLAPGAQWNLKKISAEQAWEITHGADFDAVKIAVGDTGANVYHTEFSSNLWSGQNNGEIKSFYYQNTDVSDLAGHGSNVAAIIGAQGNNGAYMTGVAWDTSLMILKVFNNDPNPTAPSTKVAEAIDYARVRGVAAMNLSLGSLAYLPCEYDETGRLQVCYVPEYDRNLRDALRRARDSGMVIVSSAGNNRGRTNFYTHGDLGNNDDDYNVMSPASIPTDNNISVLATTPDDSLASYSSYGAQRVDLGAPGGAGTSNRAESVIGLEQNEGDGYDFRVPEGPYSFFSGTSMAAPHVTGAIALIKEHFPWESYLGLRDRVLMSTDRTGTLEGRSRTNGRLNLYKALQTRSLRRNISTRARVEGGDRAMIAGFTISGDRNNPADPDLEVAMRGLGPSVSVGVPRLGNPRIELYGADGQYIDANDDWWTDWNAGRTAQMGMVPSDGNEATMLRALRPGKYTVVLRSQDGNFGVGLVELYELSGNTNERSRLTNLSTRCLVGTGEEEAVAGTIVGNLDNNGLPKPDRRLLIFGKGPTLLLGGALQDPQIRVLNTGEWNDSWEGIGTGLVEELSEALFAPTDGRESALWPTFQPGSYTVALRGTNGATGIGLIEFFEY